ncbi:MAG: HAMP domain-containing protein [Xanthomonadaceae bacterium]|nr:HAMP domain-containing protein [Xanthomonadaceae bacterium]
MQLKSLRIQLIVYVLLPVAVLTTALVWTTFANVESLVENRLQKEIELVARSLRMPVEGALREADPERLRDALGAVAEIGRVYGAAVYNAEGRRVAVAGEGRPGAAEQLQAAELVALGEEHGEYANFAGQAVYSYFVPLSPTLGRIDGLLQVVREESEIKLRLERIRRIGSLFLLGVLILILGVMLVGHRMALMRPVQRLLADMRRVERGDRDWRAEIGAPLELAQLAGGLNNMLDALERAVAEVARHRIDQQRLNQRIQQQEAEAALGRFSAGVAHELGAPLTVIQADVRRLQQSIADKEGRRRLKRIREQLERTRQLIEQLMGLVREKSAEARRFDLGAVLARAARGATPEAESRGIALEYTESRSLASTGFAIRVEHAVLNLLRNAIQAAESRVQMSLSTGQDMAVIVVEDDGPGVAVERRKEIFAPFESRRESGQGTGLGLTIVRTVAELHGGSVTVSAGRNLTGGRFEMRLPLAEDIE